MSLYESLEDKYYALMEKLHLIDVFVNPIESRGIPSFPVFALLLVAIVAGAWFVASGGLPQGEVVAPGKSVLRVSVAGADGEALANVIVTATVNGKDYLAKTNEKGIASFSDLPAGKSGTVSVSAEGFEPQEIEFKAGQTQLTVSLSIVAPAENKLVVTVTDAFGEALSGVTLSYADAFGESVSVDTDANGRAEIAFESEADMFTIRAKLADYDSVVKNCFASTRHCEIELKKSIGFCTGDECPDEPVPPQTDAKGSVRVEVTNEAGESVAARVTLYDADSVEPLSTGYSTDSSAAFFEDAAALGTSVYVIVEPESAEYARYSGSEANDLQLVESETVFQVVLQSSQVVPSSRLDYEIVDENAAAVAGASLSLYSLANPLRVVASTTSDENGEASFEVSGDAASNVYLVVFASGFLPYVGRTVEPGTQKTIVLTALVAGNNAAVRAIAVDDENAPQQLARVFLVTSDGFYSGLPAQETGADGSTEFSGVPVDGEYGFRATLGARSGKSDFFTPVIDETVNATIVLEPETGVLRVAGEDAATGESVAGARFDAVLVDSNRTFASCISAKTNSSSSNASNASVYACDLRVKTGRTFVVRASADGFAPAESEQLVLAAEQRGEKTLRMVSLRASRELRIVSFEIQDSKTGGDAKQLDAGRFYRALLTVNFPGGADASGVFMRLGNKANAADELAAFVQFDDAEATITWGTNWDESASCDSEQRAQEGSEAKWVNFEYPKFFGTKTIAARVFVKPKARARDKIVAFYRAYSKARDVVTRTPQDEELGFAEKTKDKDGCRAAANSKAYAVTQGESECTDEACLTVAFAEQDGSPEGDGFKTTTGSRFEARVTARSFTGAGAATLKISALDESLSLNEWVFAGASGGADGERVAQIPLKYDENGEASGSVIVRAKLPSQQAQLKFSLIEEKQAVAEAQKFVVVEGDARFALDVSPENVSVQTPAAIVVVVTRADDGTPVTDAKVSLQEADGEGFVFDGSPNGDYAIAGDDSEGKGKDGRYVFKRVLATSPGAFDVVAERKGFAAAAARVNANAVDFLEFSRDLSDVKLACEPVTIEVSSVLSIDVPVTASFNGAQCASLRAPGLVQKDKNTWVFTVKKGKAAKLEIAPTSNGKCYLVFNSVLPNAAGAFSATAWLDVNCAKFAPTVTPVQEPTNCSSENCGECGEKDCLALKESCEAKYARTPQNASVFVKCVQREAAKPKCDAAHCELCSEEECNALFATKNCTPLYTTPRRGFEEPVFANCTKFKMPDCSPAKFNFKNILARRLAQYHARLLLDPQYKAEAVGASAGTQIVYDMAGLRVARTGKDCTSSGVLGVSCDKTINAIVPTNGMAFSIYNQFGALGADFGAKIKEGKQKCFQLKNLDTKQALSKLASLPGDLGAALGLVPPLATHSWEIIFLPKKECVTYEWKEGDDGISRLYAKPTADGESVTLLISPFKNEQAAVELTLNIAGNEDEEIAKYAFLYTPYLMYSGENSPGVPAGFFINNMQASQTLELSGVEIDQTQEGAGGTSKISSIVADAADGGKLVLASEQVGVTRVYYSLLEGAPVLRVNAATKSGGAGEGVATEPSELVIIPKATAEDAALKCSDDECCAKTDYDAAKKQVEAEASSVFGKILAEIEEYYDGNIVDGNAALFKKALDDATADYLAQQGAYLICRNLGMDPLAKLKESCASQAFEPNYLGYENSDLQSQGFGEMYGDSFLETACDSSLVNYAFGASEAMAPGGTFMDVFKNRLTGALSPRSGTYYKKTYLVPVDIQVHVVLKRRADGTQKEGIEIYSARPKDVNSPDGASATGEWISLEGPKAWTGLKFVQDIIEGGTAPAGVLTGCLSPYFGGTPDEQKQVQDRCKLREGSSIQQRYNYCREGVEGIPTPSPSPSPGASPQASSEKCPGGKTLPGTGGDLCFYDSAEACWKNGVYGSDKCFDSLKIVSLKTNLTLDAVTEAFIKALPQFNGGLFLPKDSYAAFVARDARYASKPLCYETWTYTEAQKQFYAPDFTGPLQSPKTFWVCTPLNSFERANYCSPLRDVHVPAEWLPMQCKHDASNPATDFRCIESTTADATAPYEYKCDLQGQAPASPAPAPAASVEENSKEVGEDCTPLDGDRSECKGYPRVVCKRATRVCTRVTTSAPAAPVAPAAPAAPATRLAHGDTCDTGSTCAEGLECRANSRGNNVCLKTAGSVSRGIACADDSECGTGNCISNHPNCNGFVCGTKSNRGGPCCGSGDCTTGACAPPADPNRYRYRGICIISDSVQSGGFCLATSECNKQSYPIRCSSIGGGNPTCNQPEMNTIEGDIPGSGTGPQQ